MEVSPVNANAIGTNLGVKLLLATISVAKGELQVAGDSARYQALSQAGPFLSPSTGVLTPLAPKSPQLLGTIPIQQQQQLLQLLANPQAVLPIKVNHSNPTQVSIGSVQITLPAPLPSGEWYLQRVGQQFRIMQALQSITLQPITNRQLAAVSIHNGQLQLVGDAVRYQAPSHGGPFLNPSQGVVTPLTPGPLLALGSLASAQQQHLIQHLNTPQILVPVQPNAANLAQISVAGQSILLAMNLPAGQWYLQRIAHQLRLLQAGDPVTLLPVAGRQGNASLNSTPATPITNLPTLLQLAAPSLIANLVKQIGSFPLQPDLTGPMGILARQWLAQRDPSSSLTDLVRSLHQFQQHSQLEPDKLALYLALPYDHHGNQRRLQLSLKQYPSTKDEAKSNWLLRVQFELELGVLQGNIRWQDNQARLELLCSTTTLTETAQMHLDGLRRRLNDNGVPLQQLDCRRANISPDLRHLEQSYG